MGRSVSQLSNAQEVVFFEWPSYNLLDENEEETDEQVYEDADMVIDDIRKSIKNDFPEFRNANIWEDREDHIILEGYGTQIGLSEYCGLACLAIRVDPYFEDEVDEESISAWIGANHEAIFRPWNQFRKLGTFSNGEAVYERK